MQSEITNLDTPVAYFWMLWWFKSFPLGEMHLAILIDWMKDFYLLKKDEFYNPSYKTELQSPRDVF